MQRLFSTFADGWPGGGLLLARLLTGPALFHYDFSIALQLPSILPQITAVGAGTLLLVGLWTPVAGTLVAIVEMWIAFSGAGDPWIPTMLAALGATLAMVGPGAWSVDAHLFGRKRIQPLNRYAGTPRICPDDRVTVRTDRR